MTDVPSVGIRSGAVLQGLFILLIAAALVGCANFRRLRKNLKVMEQTSTVSGRVAAGDWKGNPIDVYLFDVDERVKKPVRVSQFQTLKEPGKYSFSVRPGYYMIGAAEDVDGDGELGAGEPHALYNDFEILNVAPNSKRSRLNMELSEERAPALDRMAAEDVPLDYELHMGDLAQLDDPRFEPSSGSMGMWQPHDFFDKYGAGVFMLQEYAEDKVPVLFIHGMSGHPREFTTLIDGLDPALYQAWVYQYPSGVRIQLAVNALHKMLESIHAKKQFERLCVVAHSMGGLLAHQLVRDQVDAGTDRYVSFLATIASPLGGISSADTGVKMAPEVVPSWRDVGPKSEFIQSLFDRPFPPDIEYALYFGFGSSSKKSKQGTDGTVLVRNALPREAQDAATVVSGFAESHTGILVNQATVQQLDEDLSALCLAGD